MYGIQRDASRLSINFNVVELGTEYVLEANIIPMDIVLRLSLIDVAEGQIGFDAIFLFVLDRG